MVTAPPRGRDVSLRTITMRVRCSTKNADDSAAAIDRASAPFSSKMATPLLWPTRTRPDVVDRDAHDVAVASRLGPDETPAECVRRLRSADVEAIEDCRIQRGLSSGESGNCWRIRCRRANACGAAIRAYEARDHRQVGTRRPERCGYSRDTAEPLQRLVGRRAMRSVSPAKNRAAATASDPETTAARVQLASALSTSAPIALPIVRRPPMT